MEPKQTSFVPANRASYNQSITWTSLRSTLTESRNFSPQPLKSVIWSKYSLPVKTRAFQPLKMPTSNVNRLDNPKKTKWTGIWINRISKLHSMILPETAKARKSGRMDTTPQRHRQKERNWEAVTKIKGTFCYKCIGLPASACSNFHFQTVRHQTVQYSGYY